MITPYQQAKKQLTQLLALITLFLISATHCIAEAETQPSLKIIGWDIYADPINPEKPIGYEKFERDTGIILNYTAVSNNNTIFSTLDRDKSYDIVISSAVDIVNLQRMQQLSPLDLKQIRNHIYLSHEPSLIYPQNNSQSPFSLPFTWGAEALLIKDAATKSQKKQPTYWNDLWKTKYKNKVAIKDDISIIYITALSLGNQNIFNLTQAQLKHVQEKIIRLKDNIRVLYNNSNDVAQLIATQQLEIIASHHKPLTSKSSNKNYVYRLPEEGSIARLDAIAITENSHQVDRAHRYINHAISTATQIEIIKATTRVSSNQPAIESLHNKSLIKIINNLINNRAKLHFLENPHRQKLYQDVLDNIRVNISTNLEVKRSTQLSASELNWIQQHNTINFTGDPNWLPYEAFTKEGDYIGIVADHLELIAKETGLRFQAIKSSSWSESLNMATEGKVSIISGDAADKILNQRFLPVKPYSHNPIVIIMGIDNNYVEDINKIKDKNIAIIKDYGYTADIYQQYPDFNFSEVENIQEGLLGVSEGRYDAMLATLALASYTMAELGIHNIKIVGKTPIIMDLTLFIDKQQPVLHSIIEKTLNSLSASKTHETFKSGPMRNI